jgi:hypothetical protein
MTSMHEPVRLPNGQVKPLGELTINDLAIFWDADRVQGEVPCLGVQPREAPVAEERQQAGGVVLGTPGGAGVGADQLLLAAIWWSRERGCCRDERAGTRRLALQGRLGRRAAVARLPST